MRTSDGSSYFRATPAHVERIEADRRVAKDFAVGTRVIFAVTEARVLVTDSRVPADLDQPETWRQAQRG